MEQGLVIAGRRWDASEFTAEVHVVPRWGDSDSGFSVVLRDITRWQEAEQNMTAQLTQEEEAHYEGRMRAPAGRASAHGPKLFVSVWNNISKKSQTKREGFSRQVDKQNMSVVEATPQKAVSLRRSQRVVLAMPVVVSGEIRDRTPFSQETRTIVVNAHGALVLLRTSVHVGQLLTLKNVKTQEQQSCRVVTVTENQEGKTEAGVEFLVPAPRFWHIAFPPLDWTPKSEEAKRATRPANIPT